MTEETFKLETCPQSGFLHFLNTETGETVAGKCNVYRCEFCGPRKARRLQNAIYQYFKKFKFLRFWTFTYSSKVFLDLTQEEKAKLSAKIWQHFLIGVRRSPLLSEYQRKFQYVKVLEFQKNGTPHYHAFFDRFIPRVILSDIWDSTISNYFQSTDKVGNIFVEGIITARKASNYVTKYLVKTIRSLSNNCKARIWSKSEKVSLFEKKIRHSNWIAILGGEKALYLYSLRASLQEKKDNLEQILHISDKTIIENSNRTVLFY